MNINISPHDQFKALADPARLRLLVLLTAGELCVGDLAATLGLPQPTVSRHLARLKLLGWVEDRRAGKRVHYRLAHPETAVGTAIAELLPRLAAEPPFGEDRQRLKEHCRGGDAGGERGAEI